VIDLAKFPLLAPLSETEREAVADEFECLELDPGVTLFSEGETANGAWFVVAGRVQVSAQRVDIGAEIGPGEVLGTLSLVLDGPREASAQTLSHAIIWRLRRSAFRRLVEMAPTAACRLLEGIVREVADAVRDDVSSRAAAAQTAAPVDPTARND
jgi:CRP-like cAMP-binding protein